MKVFMETHRKLGIVKPAYNPNIENARQKVKDFKGSQDCLLETYFKKKNMKAYTMMAAAVNWCSKIYIAEPGFT